MMAHPNPEVDAALDWAVTVNRSPETTSRSELKGLWEGEEGRRHRAALKAHLPGMLAILVESMKVRLMSLPKEPAP